MPPVDDHEGLSACTTATKNHCMLRGLRDCRASHLRGARNEAVSTMPNAPRVGRYRMPAEWEPHRATWICWPHHEPDWPGKIGPIPWVYAEIARVIAEHETL